jgi:hypothetical protein
LNDELFGGSGNDTIRGESGGDDILGEEGDDRIYGGAGNDTLSGGPGSAAGLYPDWVFESWKDIVPFDQTRDEERELRLLLGNLRWLKRPHFAYIGSSDSLIASQKIAEKELRGRSSLLHIGIVPGDHFSSLPRAIESYLNTIRR